MIQRTGLCKSTLSQIHQAGFTRCICTHFDKIRLKRFELVKCEKVLSDKYKRLAVVESVADYVVIENWKLVILSGCLSDGETI